MLRALLLIVLLLLATAAQAQTDLVSPERQALEQDLQRYQELLEARSSDLRSIESALGETAAALQQRVRERDAVSEELAQKRREREQIVAQIGVLEAARADTEERIALLEGRIGDLQVRVQDLLLSLYKQRGRRSAAGLVASETFHEMRVRNHYLGILSEQDADVLRELDSVLVSLGSEREQLAQQIAQLGAAEAELVQAEAELQGTQARLAQVIDDLNATQAGQMVQQQALMEEQTQIERTIGNVNSQLDREIARLLEEERQARAAAEQFALERDRQLELQRQADAARARADALSTPPAPNASGLIRPCDEAALISRFGDGNNSYLCIRAPVENAAVRAVQTGRVSGVTYLGANFGYMLVLQHEGGLTTIYVNMRQPLVEFGDSVTQGTVVGYLGGGTLTRNDVLHFYAQRAGSGSQAFIDPAPLLGW